jgi:glyceraldehyde 3-phosphate dehydrogenase
MGLGHIGRKIYQLAMSSDDIEIVVVEDLASPEILHYLLQSTTDASQETRVEGNYLVTSRFRTRIIPASHSAAPWDAFGVDCVIDATGRLRSRQMLSRHLDAGAPRVVMSYLPSEPLDRTVVPTINDDSISPEDRLVSAGSATTVAFGLLLKCLDDAFGVEQATLTTVHAYSSDQSLQDYAGVDHRRSRSAAENIIPNSNESAQWIERLMPRLEGRLSGFALNVPVQQGSLLDVNCVLRQQGVEVGAVGDVMREAARAHPSLIGVAEDPIVSSDVIGCPQSLLFDLKGSMRAGKQLLKTLSWYESLGQAHRVLDVVRSYAAAEEK